MTDFVGALERYGALPSQVVDLSSESARTLAYVDLIRSPVQGRAPAVVEVNGTPRAYVFDGRSPTIQAPLVAGWVRRIAFRGDAEWVGVLRPGRLDIYPAALDGSSIPAAVEHLPQDAGLFTKLDLTRPHRPLPNVRQALLTLLRDSISQVKQLGAEPADALSLIGRAIFWRFLIDRGLLDQLDPSIASPGATSWAACLSSKKRALDSFNWLEDTFNGGFLPLSKNPRLLSAEIFATAVGNVAHAAMSTGQLELPTDWRQINFAEVPVGLLSEVYEAFAHSEDPVRAREESIYYTPRLLAELVIGEAFTAIQDIDEPRVLDPAAGAGVFLVSAFRGLVAREWIRSGKKPSRSVVRRILNKQLVGFDINRSALRLAELALYLTAIELDPEDRPRPLKLLRFESLRNVTLFEKSGGVIQGSLLPVEDKMRGRFDAVVGNPPWTAGPAAKKVNWANDSREVVRSRLGDERAQGFAFPDKNPDLPFIYRAMEWAKAGGCIALLVHARWLFAQTSTSRRARQDLFECLHITGILNGTALRDTSVWPNVRHAFCALFARNELPPKHSAFLFVSPELDHTPDRTQVRFRIDWRDADELATTYVVDNPWVLKARFRATPVDEQIIATLGQTRVSLGKYLRKLGAEIRNGYQIGGTARAQQSAAALKGMRDLRGSNPDYFVSAKALPKFDRATLLYPRLREIYSAPLLLINESMTVNGRPRASLSLEDVLYDERYDGVSFKDIENGGEIARYLQLILISSLAHHALFVLDGQYGIEREVVHRESFDALPVIPWSELSRKERIRASVLSSKLENGSTSDIASEIDGFVFDLFGLSDVQRTAVKETLLVSLPTAAAKKRAVCRTTSAERQTFAAVCTNALASVLQASGKTATVFPREDVQLGPWRLLQVDVGIPIHSTSDIPPRRLLEAAEGGAASLVVVRKNATTTLVAILDAYRYWTHTRARMLAASLVGGSHGPA